MQTCVLSQVETCVLSQMETFALSQMCQFGGFVHYVFLVQQKHVCFERELLWANVLLLHEQYIVHKACKRKHLYFLYNFRQMGAPLGPRREAGDV